MFLVMRFLVNIFLLIHAWKRLPEFAGYQGKPFPRQMILRPPDIQPRRYDFPAGFQHDWRKIGSKKKKFQMYKNDVSMLPNVDT